MDNERLELELKTLKPDAPKRPAAEQTGAAIGELDERCVRAVLGGDRERFGELIERYQGAVLSVVRAYVSDAHTAEDVAQDVFVSAFSSLRQLRDPKLFLPWLLQITRHRAGLAGKRSSQDPVRKISEHQPAAPAPDDSADTRLHAVFAAIEQMPEPYRQTLLLKYQANLSCKQIADQEGVAVGTITSRLTRALVVLRHALVGPEG